jgi:beta-N-acetylhexosaminidase
MPAASSSGDRAGRRPRAAIVGIAGSELRRAERRLFARHEPLGFILFRRNCSEPGQLRRLVADLRALTGRPDTPILIDQEGGRVARLAPPHWPARVCALRIGELAAEDLAVGREAAWLQARLIAAGLHALGISVDCAPVLDLALPGQDACIGDRAFAADPDLVGELGLAAIEGFLAGGVLPVIKHLPGHGRALVDSHQGLPVVDTSPDELAASDWRPFARCRHAPLGMSAHILYPALDPARPATQSDVIVREVIRGRIGFDGALLSDDLSMGALGGGLGERAAMALGAGCDIALHCNGDLEEMQQVLDSAGELAGASAERVARALACLRPPEPLDTEAAEARLTSLLNRAPALGEPV